MGAVAITNQSYTDTTGNAEMAITGGTVYHVGLATASLGVASLNPGSPVVGRTGFRTSSIGQAELNSGIPVVNRTGLRSRTIGEAILSELGGRLQKNIGRTNSVGIASWEAAKITRTVNAPRLEFVAKGKTASRMRRGTGANLTVADAAREIYSLWGFEIEPYKIEFARERVLAAINAAVQTIHAQAHRLNYFNKTVLDVTVPGFVSSVDLDKSVQVVLGVFTETMKLREITRLSEFSQAVELYLSEDVAPDSPVFYHIENNRVNAGDNQGISIMVAPVSESGITLKVEVAIEPARYEEPDLLRQTELHIPSRFTESILWPLLRHWAASDANFRKETLRPEIEAKYDSAMETLGLLAPAKPDKKTDGGGSKP